MESTFRIITKSITWQASGLLSMALIGYLFTGSITASSGIAVAGSLTGFVCYILHEAAWSKVRWGRKSA